MKIETMKVSDLSLHPIAESTPKQSAETFAALKLSIETIGQSDPITTYRGRIIDGRHRWLALQELNIDTILVQKMPNNSTIEELKDKALAKEIRRHDTAAQMAIMAYKYITSSKDNIKQSDAAKLFGANVKRIIEAKKIAVKYGRPDILEIFFSGQKFNTGTSNVPFWTDSLGTVIRWLEENRSNSEDDAIGLAPREELTESEQIIVNQFIRAIKTESMLVKKAAANELYRIIKTGEM